MKTVSLISVLFLISHLVLGQASISGTLVDKVENTPISFASVALFHSSDSSLVNGVISDDAGTFIIEKVKPGTYYLTAKFMGFETYSTTVFSLSKNQSLNLGALPMVANDRLLEEVKISGKKIQTLHKVDRQVYETSNFQSSQGGTAKDVLKNLPSVSINAEGEISARGASGFVVLINGKPVQSDPMMLLEQLPANAVQNIELITAPSAKYDPEGKGGIINIVTLQGATDGLYTQVNAKIGAPSIQPYNNEVPTQRYGGDITLNYRKGKWDLSAGGSFLRNDIAGRREGNVFTQRADTTTFFPSDGERSFDEIKYSGRFTVDYKPNSSNSFSLGFYGGKRSKDRKADILYYDNHATVGEERLYTFQYFNKNLRIRRSDFALGSFDYGHTFNNESKLSTSFLYEYTLLGGPTTNQNLGWPNTSEVLQEEYNTNDNPLYGTRFQVDYALKPMDIGQFEIGYQYRNLDHTGDFLYARKNLSTGAFETVPEFSSTVNLTRVIHSGYAQLSGEQDKLTYNIGVRLEAMDRKLDLKDKKAVHDIDTTYLYNFIKPFPAASLQYKINDELKLKAAYSKRIERTTTFKMNPFREREHSETLEQGDPELLPEFIDLIELGVVKDFGDHSVFATAYYRDVQNLVNRVNKVFNDTILDRIYSNVGRGQSLGLEIGTQLQLLDNWDLYAGGNIYQYSIIGAYDGKPIDTKSWQYSINANSTFDITETLSVQGSVNYLSQRITAQGEDSRFLSPNLTLKKTFMDNRLEASVQWLNMDMGFWNSNQQRITTWEEGSFYTTTNYVYEVDMVMLNIKYIFNKKENKSKFIKSEFGEKEF